MLVIKDTETLTLELTGAPAATQPEFSASYIDSADDAPDGNKGALNGVTPVLAVDSPSTGKRLVSRIDVVNLDSAAVTVIAKITGGTTRSFRRVTIAAGECRNILLDVGATGADGEGVPTGGTEGQVLAKASGSDYDTEWVDQTGGTGSVSLWKLVAGV